MTTTWNAEESRRLRESKLDPIQNSPDKLEALVRYFKEPGASVFRVTQGSAELKVSASLARKVRDLVGEGKLDWVLERTGLGTGRLEPRRLMQTSDNSLGRIAFASNKTGCWEIYVMNPDGSLPQQVTDLNVSDRAGGARYPSWAPDGRKLVFSAKRALSLIDADGNNITPLTKSPLEGVGYLMPTWSPNWDKIAFSLEVFPPGHQDRGDIEIHVMDLGGSEPDRLTHSAGRDTNPKWSPTGDSILFESEREGNWEIFMMNPDGKSQTQVTNFPDSDQRYPSWSPHGNKIAFTSTKHGNLDIYVMDLDLPTEEPTRLTCTPEADTHPTWSPDGRMIAFASQRKRNPPNTGDIYVMDADGSNQCNRTKSRKDNQFPIWGPPSG